MRALEPIWGALRTFTFLDAIDILIIAYFTYGFLKIIDDIKAGRLFKGIIILAVVYGISTALNLITLSFVLKNFFAIGAVAIVVVFQPELRRILEHFGRRKFGRLGRWLGEEGSKVNEEFIKLANILCDACETMAHQKTGALLVIERTESLEDIARTGTILDAVVTKELLLNIFFVNTPLHDGAVVINDNKIHAAGCILPLSNSSTINKKYGTRHRAALGMSENSDALVIVVSEERGEMSFIYKRQIIPVKTANELKEKLLENLPTEVQEEQKSISLVQNKINLLLLKAKEFKLRLKIKK
ncbi:MAG: diadenylate cyclase CdaA [Oscillospiraceae bacterium]|nr:diadenylate cyclase CdaA [Oscillospiraceae bacterium]